MLNAIEWGIVVFAIATSAYFWVHSLAVVAAKPPQQRAVPSQIATVVIPFRNEEANIPSLIRSVYRLKGSGVHFNLVLVDDHSTDDSVAALTSAIATCPGMGNWAEIVPSTGEGKKSALATGIAHTQSEVIVCTDADTVHNPDWVLSMLSHFQAEEVVCVCGPIAITGHTVLQNLQAVESAGLVALGAGAIQLGKPTLANGANLAFRKSAYEAVGGYASHIHIASGDDELLVHQLSTLGRVVFNFSRQAVVYTAGLPRLRQVARQRMRWVSKSRSYANWSTTLGQMLGFLSQCQVFVCIALLLFSTLNPYLVGVALAIITLPTCLLAGYGLVKWNRWDKVFYLPLLTLIYPAYTIWVAWSAFFPSIYDWKGRKVQR